MKKFLLFFFVFLTIILVFLVISIKTVDPIQAQLEEMTLNEKIGQMVIVGVDGPEINNNTIKMMSDYKAGGFILFARNIENANQLINLINALKANNKDNKALFLSIDEEGGRVSRIPKEIRKLPTNKVIGAINNSDFSYKIGNIIAEELRLFGFNMNFAPVLDINSNPNNPVIGDRAFGANADIVSNLGVKTMKGIQDGHIISAAKHFPGHGDTSVDSHVGLPSVNSDIARLRNFEFQPFIDAISNNVDVIMVAHILLPNIDSEYPATLSKTIINEYLRKELAFNGVVITDDMTMGAITKNYAIGDAAVKSIIAGSDIVLVCHGYENQVTVIQELRKAVEKKVISLDRINESVYRILKLKEDYKLNNNPIDLTNANSLNLNNLNTKIDNLLKEYINSYEE